MEFLKKIEIKMLLFSILMLAFTTTIYIDTIVNIKLRLNILLFAYVIIFLYYAWYMFENISKSNNLIYIIKPLWNVSGSSGLVICGSFLMYGFLDAGFGTTFAMGLYLQFFLIPIVIVGVLSSLKMFLDKRFELNNKLSNTYMSKIKSPGAYIILGICVSIVVLGMGTGSIVGNRYIAIVLSILYMIYVFVISNINHKSLSFPFGFLSILMLYMSFSISADGTIDDSNMAALGFLILPVMIVVMPLLVFAGSIVDRKIRKSKVSEDMNSKLQEQKSMVDKNQFIDLEETKINHKQEESLRVCPNCLNKCQGNFCGNCGMKLYEVKADVICPICGQIIKSNFCENCGHKVDAPHGSSFNK